MGLATKISELLTGADDGPPGPPSERRGFWVGLWRLVSPGLAGVKLALAAVAFWMRRLPAGCWARQRRR